MAFDPKKVGMAAAGGILIAVLIISGFVWTGTLPSAVPPAEAKGTLIVRVKDAPAELLELWLNISYVQVHRKGGGNETWKNITVVAERFDLLSLRDGISTVLAFGELPEGNYTEIRFYVYHAEANITGEIQLKPLQIVANGKLMVKHSFFSITEDSVTDIEIDVNIEPIEPILHAGILRPVAKVTDIEYITQPT